MINESSLKYDILLNNISRGRVEHVIMIYSGSILINELLSVDNNYDSKGK
jgi:hypothetical protein